MNINNFSDLIHKYFPYPHAREGQMEIIKEIQKAIDLNDYKNILIDAPTGFGKSAIARTICDYYYLAKNEKSYILTATKMLQNQYFQECKHNPRVKYKLALGRGNYKCLTNGNSCDEGECKLIQYYQTLNCKYKRKWSVCDNGGCNYWTAKCSAKHSDVAIMNYHVLLSDNIFINDYPDRFLMICDEAHNIEQILMSFMKIIISKNKLKDLDENPIYYDFKSQSIEYWINVLKIMIEKIKEKIEEYKNDIRRSKGEIDKLQQSEKSFSWKLKKLQDKDIKWIVCPVKTKKGAEKVEIKPLHISTYTNNLLKSSKHHIFMSGTFIDHNQFCKDIGLNLDESYYLRAKSTFNMKNRNKIYTSYAGSLGYSYKQKTKPLTIPILKKIFKKHENECGLIHANSKDFANYIIRKCKDNRLITYTPKNKNEQLKVFEESEDKIMVSYSLQEGLNLPDDNIRFQIFYKVPYPFLGDKQIKSRAEIDPNWYNVETVRTILQSWGTRYEIRKRLLH